MDKIEVMLQMLKDHPEQPNTWFLLGLEYKEQGKINEALKAFTEALKYSNTDLKEKILLELTTLANLGLGTNMNSLEESSSEDFYEDDEKTDSNMLEENNNLKPFKVIDGGLSEQKQNQENNKVITFENVGGLEDLQEAIRMKIIKPFINPVLFARFKKKTGGGIVLFGPPGCGKTFIAKATAGECKAQFIPVQISDILDPFIGVSEQNIRDIFSTARAKKPSVLFFDELDAIGYHRAKASSSHMRPMVDQLLSEMEGIDTSTDQLLVIGATNMPWDVDPAFLRPGRFDKVIFVPPPDEFARGTIFRLKMEDRPINNIDFGLLAKATELYSGADIENVVELATEKVLSNIMSTGIERPIEMTDLMEAVSETKPTTIEWLRTIKNYVKYANQGGLYSDVADFLSKNKKI